MTLVSNFEDLPPFPDDVPTAPLIRLSLDKLLRHDEEEVHRFCNACEDLGFFYLDLRDADTGASILSEADKLFNVGEELLALDLAEKRKYDFSKKNSYFGYKAMGAAVINQSGKLDKHEFYNVSKDDILGVSEPLPAPDVLKENQKTLESFMRSSHSIVTLVLDLLNQHLELPPSTLAKLHRLDKPSGDQVRFIRAPPLPVDERDITLGEHTDFGSVTVLFNRVGGLQILPPGEDATWSYVRPLPGHAIINLGDSMVKFTNGLLRSNIHRVVSPPGLQADTTRYSLVYFSRPEDDVLLTRLQGSDRIPPLLPGETEEQVNSKDWVIRRALARRVELQGHIDFEKAAGTENISRRIKV